MTAITSRRGISGGSFYFLYFLVVLICNEYIYVCVCVCVCVCVYTYTYICYMYVHVYRGFPSGSVVKNLPAMKEMWIQFLGQGKLPRGGNNNPLQYSSWDNPMDGGIWQATVHRVKKSQTLLKQLSTHTDTSI